VTIPAQLFMSVLNRTLRSTAFALELVCALVIVTVLSAQAQTFTVIHNFTGGGDGFYPKAGVTLDQAGNLYGTADGFESYGYGTVYKLTHQGSNWSLNPLYEFTGGRDGANPEARVIFGPNGTLYGTTYAGGTYNGGTVFSLRPYPTVCKTALCPWAETVLYPFSRGADGYYPSPADLIFDQAGNIYGTTIAPSGDGVVYELTPSGGGWTESVLHSFSGSPDGAGPYGGVIRDNAGNLYGTTESGGTGSGQGTVFELTYSTGSGWSESILYSFQGGSDGGVPLVGLIFDPLGNLYGATSDGGSGGGGTVFKLTPFGGSWTFSLVYSFTGNLCGPGGKLVMDGAGSLYGTTACDGAYNEGSIFELTPSNGAWTYRSLHDFCAGGYPCSDGRFPLGNVVFDTSGNLYGTAEQGGTDDGGVVWEITP